MRGLDFIEDELDYWYEVRNQLNEVAMTTQFGGRRSVYDKVFGHLDKAKVVVALRIEFLEQSLDQRVLGSSLLRHWESQFVEGGKKS